MGMIKWIVILAVVFIAVIFAAWSRVSAGNRPERLSKGLEEPDVIYYSGQDAAGGLAHIHYWTIDPSTLPDRESRKAQRIQANQLHSRRFQPTRIVPGYEAGGILDIEGRRQWVTLRLPDDWNGRLVVCGTPGLRNEYANEAVFMPWLLAQGYAVVSGDKGLENGWVSMLTGTHPTQHWGRMMHDMARWAQKRIFAATWRRPKRIYAVGLSNGGYQVRRALEIDAAAHGFKRLFSGGLDWSGTYFPDARAMDTDRDGVVDVAEFHAAGTLVNQMDVAARTMRWAYDQDTLTTPAQYARTPRFADAREDMASVGFTPESDIFWGFYNTNYDTYKGSGLPQWQGVGYFNLTAYVYRAELLGHDQEQSAGYSCFYDAGADTRPPLYDWLNQAAFGGWTQESVKWALANANTAEFKAPLITVVGTADGLLPLNSHSAAYQQAVSACGRPELYRQYRIEHGPHVDAHADGSADFDFDGTPGNEGAADELTPMQAYVQRAFAYLVDWIEKKTLPPESRTLTTDPLNDVTDPDELQW